MRDHIITILRDARSLQLIDECKGLAENIETEAMAALQGENVIVPSKLFGDIELPQNVIAYMSNGDDDMWFSHGCALDINIFHDKEWMFAIYPIKNGDTDTGHIIETGQL